MTPYIVFFPNNDDVAGTPVILFSGMGSNDNFDSHGTISSLMYGIDNWIYGHTGYNGCTANPGSVNCGKGRTWRFRHTAIGHSETKFEAWTTGPSNAWGIGQMEDGQIFQSGATGTPHINHSIRKGVAAIDIRSGTGANLFYPITGDRYLWEGSTGKTNNLFTSSTTAVSGMQFYTSRLFPQKYWSRFAFACEGANKLCNQDSLVRLRKHLEGRAHARPRPLQPHRLHRRLGRPHPRQDRTRRRRLGPRLVQLPLPPQPRQPHGRRRRLEQRPARQGARPHLARYPDRGTPETILNLSSATVPQLVDALGNQNLHWRLQAQRLLIQKGWSAELGTLLQAILTTDRSVDAIGNNPRVIHAVWTLSGPRPLHRRRRHLGPHPQPPAHPSRRRRAQQRAEGHAQNRRLRHRHRRALRRQRRQCPCAPAGPGRLLGNQQQARRPARHGLTGFQNTDSYSQSAFTASGLTAAASLLHAGARPGLGAAGTPRRPAPNRPAHPPGTRRLQPPAPRPAPRRRDRRRRRPGTRGVPLHLLRPCAAVEPPQRQRAQGPSVLLRLPRRGRLVDPRAHRPGRKPVRPGRDERD